MGQRGTSWTWNCPASLGHMLQAVRAAARYPGTVVTGCRQHVTHVLQRKEQRRAARLVDGAGIHAVLQQLAHHPAVALLHRREERGQQLSVVRPARARSEVHCAERAWKFLLLRNPRWAGSCAARPGVPQQHWGQRHWRMVWMQRRWLLVCAHDRIRRGWQRDARDAHRPRPSQVLTARAPALMQQAGRCLHPARAHWAPRLRLPSLLGRSASSSCCALALERPSQCASCHRVSGAFARSRRKLHTTMEPSSSPEPKQEPGSEGAQQRTPARCACVRVDSSMLS